METPPRKAAQLSNLSDTTLAIVQYTVNVDPSDCANARINKHIPPMGRMTRAKAAEVAERMHIDEDAALDLSQSDIKPATPEPAERAVLGDLAPNSAEAKVLGELVGKKTRSKKKGRAAAAENEAEAKQEDVRHEEEMSVEEVAERDALETTTNETMERLANLRITSLGNDPRAQAISTPTAEREDVATPVPEVIAEAPANVEAIQVEDNPTPAATPSSKSQAAELPNMTATSPQDQAFGISEEDQECEEKAPEAPSSPVATAMPKVIKGLRNDTPSKRSTSNKENVEPVVPLALPEPVEHATTTSPPAASTDAQQSSPNAVATQDATSPSARHISNGKSEDSIEALDNLDEVVEKVSKEIPDILASPQQKRTPKKVEENEKPKKVKAAPVVRMTKAAAARLSMAQGTSKDASNASSAARPRPSTMLGRASSVRQSVVPAGRTAASSGTAPAKKPSPRPKKETIIPHSKPRPVALSFPTPPPAARSSKAPTKSTFQLPGEAVAAKLKAAREERIKREEAVASAKATAKATSDEKKPAFKARPVPSALKKTPNVRHTAASRARESIMTGDAAPKPAPSALATGLKRSNTVGASRPRPSTSSAAAAKPSAPPQLNVQKRPRPSSMQITSGEIAAPRNHSSVTDTAPSARNTSTSSKGKEVYARFSAARNAAENEKREKEDAARKARAAAAERGRALSREWAEKQKVKKMAAKFEGAAAKA